MGAVRVINIVMVDSLLGFGVITLFVFVFKKLLQMQLIRSKEAYDSQLQGRFSCLKL